MHIKLLNSQQVFEPGAEIWILPKKQQSPWLGRIDWLCNYLFRKWEMRPPIKLAPELRAILSQEEIEEEKIEGSKEAPLLLATHAYLPNSRTIVIDAQNLEVWCDTITTALDQINPKSVRLFLPEKITLKTFENAWAKANAKIKPTTFEFKEIEIVGENPSI